MRFSFRVRRLGSPSRLWKRALERVCLHSDIVAAEWAARCTDNDWLTLTNNTPLYNVTVLDWDPGGICANGSPIEFGTEWELNGSEVMISSVHDDILATTTNQSTIWKVSELRTLLEALGSVIAVPGLAISVHLEVKL